MIDIQRDVYDLEIANKVLGKVPKKQSKTTLDLNFSPVADYECSDCSMMNLRQCTQTYKIMYFSYASIISNYPFETIVCLAAQLEPEYLWLGAVFSCTLYYGTPYGSTKDETQSNPDFTSLR